MQLSASQMKAPATTSALPGLKSGPPKTSPASDRRSIDQLPTGQRKSWNPTVPTSWPLARWRMSTMIVAVLPSSHESVPVTSTKPTELERAATGSTVRIPDVPEDDLGGLGG